MTWPEAIYKICEGAGTTLIIIVGYLAFFTNFFENISERWGNKDEDE